MIFCLCGGAGIAAAQTSVFTYQGKLTDNSAAANGQYDFTFRLFDAATGGTQIGTDMGREDIQVTNGIFTVSLDFGANAFTNGAARFLEISVRAGASSGAFATLAPRQEITSSPYAIKSLNATTADNSLQLGGTGASQFVQTNDTRLSDDRNPLPNSPNYIQNRTTPQPNSSFSITQSGYIGGSLRIEGNGFIIPNTPSLSLSSSGIFQIDAPFSPSGRFVVLENGNVGIGNGAPTEKLQVAGNVSASGTLTAAQYNIGGSRVLSVAGTDNLFAGINAGTANTMGFRNSFFGVNAGANNIEGFRNSFVGDRAGFSNTNGIGNSFFGSDAGLSNTIGNSNSFVGANAGLSNTTGGNNTIIGVNANVGANNLTFATAIGSETVVNSSNTIALGRANGADKVVIYGLGAAGSTNLCRNASNEISFCSSSLRYKTGVQNFTGGLNIVRRLRPIAFNWINGGMSDVGFAAEEVNKIEPLLTTTNSSDEIEGVKYGQLTTVLVNAVKEQQAQIELQQKLIKSQQQQIDALKKLVCELKPEAPACKK